MTKGEKIAHIDAMAKGCIRIIELSDNPDIGLYARAIMEDLNRLAIEIEDDEEALHEPCRF